MALLRGAAFILSVSSSGVSWAEDLASPWTAYVHDSCAACHGQDGNSKGPFFPKLSGQQEPYLETQLKAFRDQTRTDPHAQAYMWGQARNLNDATIKGLSEYFSALKPKKDSSGEESASTAAGKLIFVQGLPAKGVAPCVSCHGAIGEGGAGPRLAGQKPAYVARQLEAFRNSLRASSIMNPQAKNLTDEEIEDVAAYLSTL